MKKNRWVSVAVIMFLLCSGAAKAEKIMYPHPEVAMEVTGEESVKRSLSGREWRMISGDAKRPDMEHGELRYEICLPETYDSTKVYPVLVYLHGGSVGYHRSDGATPWTMKLSGGQQLAERVAEAIEDCIIFAPQAPGAPQNVNDAANAYWSELPTGMVGTATTDKSESSPYLKAVEKMMADFLEKGITWGENVYTVDANRLYVTGHSMGGIGTYTILRDCPDMFAAAIIGAGIGDPDTVEAWKDTPVRIFHGKEDDVIPVKPSELMAEALQAVNPRDAVVSMVDGFDHDIEWLMYGPENDEGKSESLSWMAAQRLGKDDNTFLYVGTPAAILVIAVASVLWAAKRKEK